MQLIYGIYKLYLFIYVNSGYIFFGRILFYFILF
jgi:hypothetical protein